MVDELKLYGVADVEGVVLCPARRSPAQLATWAKIIGVSEIHELDDDIPPENRCCYECVAAVIIEGQI